MNGTGGGGVMRSAVRKQVPGNETSARDAKHKWARVWCRTRPAPRNFARGGAAAHRAWRQRNASVVVRRNINHIGMVVYGVYAIGL